MNGPDVDNALARVEGSRSAPLPPANFMSPDFLPGFVSVIIPTYNRRTLLLEALDSVAAQTYRPIEAIVVDDGSTDGTAEAVAAWHHDLPPERRACLDLRLLTQPNSGAQRARNLGLSTSSGEYIQFFDSDDLLLPEKLERQIAYLAENPDVDFVYSSAVIISGSRNERGGGRLGHAASMTLDGHLRGQPLQTALGLYRRGVCTMIGPWNETLRVWQEREYNLRLFLQGARIGFLDRVFLEYRVHQGERISDNFLTPSLVDTLGEMALQLVTKAQANQRDEGLACIARQCLSVGLHAAAAGRWAVAQRAVQLAESLPIAGQFRRKIWVARLLVMDAVPAVARRAAAVTTMRCLKWRRLLRARPQ